MPTYATGKKSKQAILESACELFAQNGLHGASIRDIVSAAGTTLSSVNYYFGSKEQLYVECVQYILGRINYRNYYSDLDSLTFESDEELAATLHARVMAQFHDLVIVDNGLPGRLLTRCPFEFPGDITRKGPYLLGIHDIAKRLARVVPALDVDSARLWLFNVTGQIQNYTLNYGIVLGTFSLTEYNEEFLMKASRIIADSAVAAAGLPIPSNLTQPESAS